MVQIWFSGERKLNDYWKILDWRGEPMYAAKSELQRLQYAFKNTEKRDRLRVLVGRARRGMMSYEPCSVAELRRFCKDRKILVPTSAAKDERKVMTSLLEKADEEKTFAKFQDLPAELRNRIYDIHFDSMRLPYLPCQVAPVAQVSRDIRSECLPMFCAAGRLRLVFVLPQGLRKTYYFRGKGANMLAKATDDYASKFLRLEIAVQRRKQINSVQATELKWHVDILDGGYTLRRMNGATHMSQKDKDARLLFEAAIKEHLDGKKADKKIKLQTSDGSALLAAIQQVANNMAT